MDNYDYRENKSYRGYRSEKDKSQFTTYVVVLVIIMFIVPFFLFFLTMPFFMVSSFFSITVPSPNRGTFYKGKIYYPVNRMNSKGGQTLLCRVSPGAKEKPEVLEPINLQSPWLMEFENRLMFISQKEVGEYKDGEITTLFRQRLGTIFKPFVYEGKIAVIEKQPDGLYLRTLSGKKWEKAGKIFMDKSEEGGKKRSGRRRAPSLASSIQVLKNEGEYFYFYYMDNTLFMRKGIPFVKDGEPSDWIAVENNVPGWTAASYMGKPVVFCTKFDPGESGTSFSSRLIGFKWDGKSWNKFYEYKGGMITDMGVYSQGNDREFYFFYMGFPGASHLITIRDGIVVNDQKTGEGFFSKFPFVLIIGLNLFLMVFYLVIVFFISKLMVRYRITQYRGESFNFLYASLWKRAVARLFDTLILAGPGIFIYARFFTNFFRMENFSPSSMFSMVGNIMICFVWGIAIGLVFWYMEGKSGQSPGKKLMKIKVVGTDNDQQPVGFGRAIIRNLLLMVDGFFHYLVGILMIAFMENWQRIGDLAAKTVVVEEENK